MKQKYAFLFLTVLSAVFSCAQIDEGNLEEKVEVEKVAMTFTASIEKDVDTKTELGGNVGDALRKVYWQSSDKIGVTVGDASEYTGYPPVEVFTSTSASRTEKAEFDGSIAFSSSYHAFYPYSTELRDSCGVFVFNLPQVQKYVRGTFDPNAAPMAAKASAGEELQFRNLCGILALQLKGAGSVKSITFMGRDEMGQPIDVAGKFEVDMLTDDYPNLKVKSNQKSSVTLECGEAVALSSASDTPFYLVLPPATYSSFMVLITMADGRVMIKEGTKPLTIKRSDIANASSLTYVESVALDLSERGNSNCYIVPKAGIYSFDASVIGNREFGIMDGFHTDNVKISPSTVSLLWEDRSGVVLSPSMDGNKVRFIATGREGNALLAVNDANGQTLWSWHIWVTDQPQEQVYVNNKGTFTVLDRNLGATHNASDDWMNSRGLVYQWGRKDPFTMGEYGNTAMFSINNTQTSIAEAIANPTVFEGSTYRGWVSPDNTQMWNPSRKTIYDPCPIGYRVSIRDVWSGFLQDDLTSQYGITEKYNVSGGWDKGWNFLYDGVNSTYYPASPRIDYDGYYLGWNTTEYSHMWSAEYSHERNAYRLYFYFYNDASSHIELYYSTGETSAAYPVRCMKDEGYVDTALPTVRVVNVTDKTANSVRILSEVTYEGASEVTERGVILSPTPDFNEVITVKRGSGLGQYEHYYYNLTEATRYYVKAYAVNSYGVSFSDVVQFATAYSGEGWNLSDGGVANSYMVLPYAGTFFFDASVKGNSVESTGLMNSAELVWAVDQNHNSSDNIIQDVQLNGNLVFFQTPESVVPGNALIAVKDHNGQILWSWHIWVVDYEPESDYQTYYSGAKMMDRNLGASKAMPELADYVSTWKPAAGTLYQWGRKDPIIYEICSIQHNSFSSVEEAAANPSVFGAGGDYWLSPFDEYLWLPDSKTKYDPCPAGWRVAPKSAWIGVTCNNSYYPYGNVLDVGNGAQIWTGFGPYMHSGGDYFENSGSGYTWTSDYNHGSIHGWTIYYHDGYWNYSSDMNATDGYPVRCMKE